VLDRGGADGLTMRAVAEALGASPAALYGHVANKEELVQLVLEQILGEFADYVERLFTEELDWREKLVRFGEQARVLFLRHPGSAGLRLGRVPFGPNLLRIVEALLRLLRDAGVPDRVAAFAGDLFSLYTGAFVYEEEQRPPAGTPGVPEVVQWLSGLPRDRFPNTVELAQTLVSGSIEDRYSWGLELLVRGLATYATPRPVQSSPKPR
jgi:AcrR family transcriptional regulator